MGNQLEIVRGTTAAWGLAVTDQETGNEYTLESGQVLVFAIKREKTDTERLLVKKITHAVNGEYYLELTPADTADLEPGRYWYDVGLQHGNSVFYNVIRADVFTVLPGVTQLGDGA